MCHKPRPFQRKCSRTDLILVHEGVQCGNCLELISSNGLKTPPELTREERIERLAALGIEVEFSGVGIS